MTLEELIENDLIVFECISGSRAYGLATSESDEDIKGVFVLPQDDFYGLQYVDYLLDIKRGAFEYEDLLEMAQQKIEEVEEVYKTQICQRQLMSTKSMTG